MNTMINLKLLSEVVILQEALHKHMQQPYIFKRTFIDLSEIYSTDITCKAELILENATEYLFQ